MPVDSEDDEHGEGYAPHETEVVAFGGQKGQQENTQKGAVGISGHGQGELD